MDGLNKLEKDLSTSRPSRCWRSSCNLLSCQHIQFDRDLVADLFDKCVALTFKCNVNVIEAGISVKPDGNVALDSIQCSVRVDVCVLLVM